MYKEYTQAQLIERIEQLEAGFGIAYRHLSNHTKLSIDEMLDLNNTYYAIKSI